jgi:hypothetical protein
MMADEQHPVDLGSKMRGKLLITTKCMVCNKNLCTCPQRQVDKTWKQS